jgi:hypothetical protein
MILYSEVAESCQLKNGTYCFVGSDGESCVAVTPEGHVVIGTLSGFIRTGRKRRIARRQFPPHVAFTQLSSRPQKRRT